MYLEFFGLKEKPFSLTPDPRFLFLSESHRQALDHMLYGIQEHEGFILIVGDIGTGKTTICRELLEKLDKKTASALILNPLLSEQELLVAVLQDFGILPSAGTPEGGTAEGSSRVFESLDAETQNALELNPLMPGKRVLENILRNVGQPETPATKKDLIDRLNAYLLALVEEGGNAVLIIDEAQNLSPEVLEQIRILSNLETTKRKLLQIILVGQLELKSKLEQPGLRQLNQRISIRYRLKPLTLEETKRYVEHRLFVAGSNSSVTFSDEAYTSVYEYSRGVPRLVNLICERCVLGAYVDQVRRVDADLVLRCRDSLEGNLEDGGRPGTGAGAPEKYLSRPELLSAPEQRASQPRPPEKTAARPEEAVAQPWERKEGGPAERDLKGGSRTHRLVTLAIAALAIAGVAFVFFIKPWAAGALKRSAKASRESSATLAREISPAVRLAFSIQLGAYQSLDEGLEQVRLFSEQGLKKPLYIVPLHIVQLGGRWYRLFYGGYPSTEAARGELDGIVERGLVKAGSARILETPLTFSLGDYADLKVAEDKQSEYLRRWQIPAYVFVLEQRETAPVYRLYSGAFEAREQASFLSDRLEAAGLSHDLAERLGYWPLK